MTDVIREPASRSRKELSKAETENNGENYTDKMKRDCKPSLTPKGRRASLD